MTLAELAQSGRPGRPPDPVAPFSSPKPRRHKPLITAAAIVVLVTALVVLGLLAATYQPLVFGGAKAAQFPGLPIAKGERTVNNFGGLASGDLYIPPQRGTFAIMESVQNNGPRAVTIGAVSVLAPGSQGAWPLVPAGPVLYMPEYYYHNERSWTSGRPIKGISLGPNQGVLVGIPLRLSNACYEATAWSEVSEFYVEESYLGFTHWVGIPLGTPVLVRAPEAPDEPTAGLVCPR